MARVSNLSADMTIVFKTLIVDDSETFRHLLKEILSARFPSMEITEAVNASSVLEQVNRLGPDLILMDIKLPDGSGLGLTRSIKVKHPDTIVAIITAYDLPEYRYAASKAGANHFIHKDSFAGDDILNLVVSIVSTQDKH